MARPKSPLAPSPVVRYGIAATSSTIALGLALLAQRSGFRNVDVPLFLFAIVVTAWYAGDRVSDSCGCTFKFGFRLLLH